MEHAATVLTSIEAGNASKAQDTSSKFLEAVQESQVLLLDVASRQQTAIPYALDSSTAKLEAAAAERESLAETTQQQPGTEPL